MARLTPCMLAEYSFASPVWHVTHCGAGSFSGCGSSAMPVWQSVQESFEWTDPARSADRTYSEAIPTLDVLAMDGSSWQAKQSPLVIGSADAVAQDIANAASTSEIRLGPHLFRNMVIFNLDIGSFRLHQLARSLSVLSSILNGTVAVFVGHHSARRFRNWRGFFYW